MTGLSTNGSYRIVEGATHISLVYRQADAQVCADGILDVLEAVRSGKRLVVMGVPFSQISKPGWRVM